MSNLDTKDIEILRLKLQLAEAQLAAINAPVGRDDKDKIIAELRGKLDEPAPIVSQNVLSEGVITREILASLSPAELFILARKRGIKIETMFPI